MEIYVAKYGGGFWEFEAYGESLTEARDLLIKSVKDKQANSNHPSGPWELTPDWYSDISVEGLKSGDVNIKMNLVD